MTEDLVAVTRVDPSLPPLEWMKRAWSAFLDDFEQIRPYFEAYAEMLPKTTRSPELRALLAEHFRRQRANIASMLTESIGPGITEEQAMDVAWLQLAIGKGLMIQSVIDPEHAPTAERLAAANIAALIAAVEKG